MPAKKNDKKWIKSFGIRASVLTIYASAKGHKHIKDAYGLPSCKNYKYIDGEEFMKADYLKRLNGVVKKDPKEWVKKIVDKLSLVTDELESLCRQKKKYRTNLEIYNDYKEFFEKFSYFLGICDIPIFIEEAVSEKILYELEKRKVKNIDRYFQILTTYLKDLHHNQEEKEFLKITIRVNKQKNLFLNNFKEFKKTKLYQEILNHHAKYSWMGLRLLLGRPHSLNYFLKGIKKNLNSAQKRLNEVLAKQKQNRELFRKAVKELKLDKKLLQTGQSLIWIRDKRYVGLTRGGFNKRDLFEKIAQKLKIDRESVVYLLPEEIKAGLLDNKKINKRSIKERKRGYVILIKKGKVGNLIVGKGLARLKKEEIKQIRELKGKTANPGYASGIVKIIIQDKDLLKFKTGEILVTNMTTPDYLATVKKAAAIVTDIGGITCHAAIISREMDIPCVIGTEIATRVLKNGDRVEVDATKGIIKILK